MNYRTLVLLAAASALIGCTGCDSNPCEELCRDIEGKVEEQLMVEIDCSEERWTSAGTCADCLYVLERDYQASMVDSGEICEKHFGESDPCQGITCSGHGTCRANNGPAVCDCDDGYYPEGPECLPEPTVEEFIQGADLDPCTANVPVCQTTAGCVLGDNKYIQGSFPGYASFVVVTPADAVIVVSLFLDNQSHPGEDTQITWYEPGCHDSYTYESLGADIFDLAGGARVFSKEQAVRISGDHLLEIYSDCTADYYLRVEVIVE